VAAIEEHTVYTSEDAKSSQEEALGCQLSALSSRPQSANSRSLPPRVLAGQRLTAGIGVKPAES
jgi:hypothetical protein